MKVKEFTVKTPSDFSPVIAEVLASPTPAAGAHVVTLTGDLGAGKTTFTQQLAAHLAIRDVVVSPTFVVMKSYELVDHPDYDQLVHIDAYRIEDSSEVAPLRLEELFTTARTLICLEWPEKIETVLPQEKTVISITITSDEARIVTVQKQFA